MDRRMPISGRLDISRDTEILERFVAINLSNKEDTQYDIAFKQKIQPFFEAIKPKNETAKRKPDMKFKKIAGNVKKTKKITKVMNAEQKTVRIQEKPESFEEQNDKEPINTEERIKQFLQHNEDEELPPPQPQPDSKDVVTQEIKTERKKKKRRSKQEEMFTDKDRAAAVNLGSKDIKQSLKIKRKLDRSRILHIPDEAEPGTFLALGNYEMCKGDYKIALDFMGKALELNPTEKDALVARSKCYILMGQPENGLKDAETALTIDKSCIKAIYQKAESLYYLGDFEHSLMYYHRGFRFRPDHEGFKLGVQKAQKAIENAIGDSLFPKPSRSSSRKTTSSKSSTARTKPDLSSTPDSSQNKNEEKEKERISRASQRSAAKSSRSKSAKRSRLLRELAPDKEYLDNLLTNPNIKCKYKENDETIVNCIKDAVNFLNTREEFWRQQLPPNLK